MKAYYEDSAVVIYHGDCREILPEVRCDCVVTSPPFNLFEQYSSPTQFCATPRERIDGWYKDAMPEAEYQVWQRKCIAAMRASCDGTVFYNHQVRYAWGRKNEWYHPVMWLGDEEVWCEIIWNRGKGISGAKRPVQFDQRIYMIGQPKVWNPNGLSTVWNVQEERSVTGHPCAFPLEIPLRCISMSTERGDTVCDPFLGTGTTLRAAKDLGRKAIGIEIEERYAEIAARRMEQEVLPLTTSDNVEFHEEMALAI